MDGGQIEIVSSTTAFGRTSWVLLHIEVQGPGGEDISWRMASYHALIFSHYRREPVALASLTSPRLKERIGTYEQSQYGTRHLYCYDRFELYAQDDEELLQSDDVLDLAFYAAKKALLCKDEERRKFHYLLKLTRLLAEKGWSEKDRRDLLIFIERIIDLRSHELRQQYMSDIMEMKGESDMVYVSFIEEHFHTIGMAEGRAEGERQAQLKTAKRMLDDGMSSQDVLKYTDISSEDLKGLQKG